MRKKNNTIILERGDRLYRYDICTGLPSKWDDNFHNTEYAGSQFGNKNCIGAIFLYDKEISAKQVLATAINNQQDKGISIKNGTITTVTVNEEIKLLDLEKGLSRCCHIISLLHELRIKITNQSFTNYQKGQTFETIHSDLEKLYSQDPSIKNKAATRIDEFFFNHTPLLGQLLTDFQNGIEFRHQLCEKGFEGYIFMELFSSNTYCIFSPDKLSLPSHSTISVDKDEELQELIKSNRKGGLEIVN